MCKIGTALMACCWLSMAAPIAMAQSTGGEEASDDAASDLAAAVQNPLATLVSLPLQFNFNEKAGPDERRVFNLNVQPVVPFPGEKWNIITRTIIPVNSVPIGETDSEFGIGDTSLSIFWSPAKASRLTWGIGPAFSIPTASNPELLGSGKFSLGPTAVVFYGKGKWTAGFVASNVWSVAGDEERDDVNFFFTQWFINYNFGKGWAFGTAPMVTADWEAVDTDDRWTIPWGAQVSKVTHFGSRPVNLLLGYYYNATRPDGAAEYQIRFQLNLLFPQKPK